MSSLMVEFELLNVAKYLTLYSVTHRYFALAVSLDEDF